MLEKISSFFLKSTEGEVTITTESSTIKKSIPAAFTSAAILVIASIAMTSILGLLCGLSLIGVLALIILSTVVMGAAVYFAGDVFSSILLNDAPTATSKGMSKEEPKDDMPAGSVEPAADIEVEKAKTSPEDEKTETPKDGKKT